MEGVAARHLAAKSGTNPGAETQRRAEGDLQRAALANGVQRRFQSVPGQMGVGQKRKAPWVKKIWPCGKKKSGQKKTNKYVLMRKCKFIVQ